MNSAIILDKGSNIKILRVHKRPVMPETHNQTCHQRQSLEYFPGKEEMVKF